MKKYRFVLSLIAFVLIAGVSFVACDDDGGGSSQDARALTERDFFNNPGLSANPEEGVVVVFLEPTDAPDADNLTGGLGFDIIPHKYTRTLNHTICWEDDNVDSKHFMILQNSDGEEVLRVLANGGCVTERIEAGDYEMILTHGGYVDEIEPVFLMPALEDEQVAKRDEFERKEIRTANGFPSKMHRHLPGELVKFFESISNVFTRPAIAQTDNPDGPEFPTDINVTTLINTNACVGCFLAEVDLTGVDLTFADLTGADLSGANLSGVELFESILFKTILIHANLSRADLRGADLREANLSEADLSGAFLDNAFLSGANLTFADLTGASLDFTDLRFATWIDGGICDFTSIGACNISDDNASPCDTIALASDNIIKCLLPTVVKEVCADPCPADLALVEEGCGECTMTDPEDLVISVDLVDIFNQASSATSLNLDIDTPIAILAWGGEGGIGTNDLLTSGGDGGASGFASTVTTLSDFQDSFGQTTFFYYLAEAGDFGLTCGIGGASTLVMLVENSPGSLDDVLLIAGGGGGGENSGTLSPGDDGGQGGIAAASVIGIGSIGVGQGTFDGAEGGSTDGDGIGGSGGSSDADGHDGIGGEGGNPNGVNTQWLNGDPGVGSKGQGGDSEDLDSGGCGGGGGYGGGGVGTAGAGGGSWALIPTKTCSTAPNLDSVPSNPSTTHDDFGSLDGAVEVWIFADGC